ncbi:MAG: hypothetical protein IJ773_01015 [Lachnospiraceae bacterium]|nr:hypothetical protein [Lachnospiraceae bacterium]
MTNENREIELDRMRFTKNTLSSGLALLAILFNVFFFVSIYKSDVSSYYYNILIGASILYNLIFMLAAFLASEGIKNYKVAYSWLLILLGIIQIARIFIYPMTAHAATVTIKDQVITVMETPQFVRCVVYLCASAVCCLVSAVIGFKKSSDLSGHLAAMAKKAA